MSEEESGGYGKRSTDGLEISTRMGSVRANGHNTVLVVCVACATLLIWYFIEQHGTATAAQVARVIEYQKDTALRINDLREAVQEQTYVLTLSADKREALQLEIPESLRLKLRRNDNAIKR